MKKLFIISAITVGLALTSCDSYLDINQDPNSPTESGLSSDKILPAAEMALSATYGDLLRIPAGYFTQHYAQTFGTSNYLDYSRFTMSATRSGTAYSQLTRGAINNLLVVRSKAEASKDWGTYLAATTLRVFAYQVLVDCYGEIPYSEAFNVAYTSPKYDEGKDVYAGLVAELDDALSKVDASDEVTTNFLFPGATAAKWIQFANALKLRLLMRESGVVDVNNQLSALVAENNFPTADVAYKDCWKNESGQMSPFYAEEFSTAWGSTQINVIANVAITGTMQQAGYTDPRLAAFFETNSDGNFTGGVSGSNFSTSKVYKSTYWCRPVASYDMPVYLITVAETEFFLSEYYAKQNNTAQAAAHYAAAVEASFATAGVDGAAANIAQFPYDQANYKQVIGIAKWVALSGINNYESWCELRRLKYPAFGTIQGSDIYDLGSDASSYTPNVYVPGTLYTPIQVFGQVGDNQLLQRWPYADESSASNPNAPKFLNTDYVKPVFWAN